ncbi:MAG: hypothetical protein R3335_12990, partial [Anaerolineales bacterium]|nr:hypothetical protein [Anaerolineales bacterium]
MVPRVAALAAATLLFESTLLRLLSVAQFYHFAFLVVSLALLGFGASGTMLSVFPRVKRLPHRRLFALSGVGFCISVLLSDLIINLFPFDSYSIAWDSRQIILLVLYLVALTVPFIFTGLAVGALISTQSGRSHTIYAANLVGSACGVLAGLVAMRLAGVQGAMLLSALLGLGVAVYKDRSRLVLPVLGGGLAAFLWITAMNQSGQAPLGLTISPYKALSQAARYPGSALVYGRWSEGSRLDVIRDAGIRKFPGLSYVFQGELPEQMGLAVDGDNLQPITLAKAEEIPALAFLPESLAFSLIEHGSVLILEPAGGLAVLQALADRADKIVSIASDPAAMNALGRSAGPFNPLNREPAELVLSEPRAYLASAEQPFGVIYYPLTDEYRPVVSGAYSLSENYLLTVESFHDSFAMLEPGGVMVASRWLQTPPSEEIRLVNTVAAALIRVGKEPDKSLVVYRSLQTVTVLARPDGWSQPDLQGVREFLSQRRFDLVWAPDMQPEEANRYNRFPEPTVYLAVKNILDEQNRDTFLRDYPF